MQHIIQRQTIEISTADIESANLLQQHMDSLFKLQSLPIMDKVLSSFSDTGNTIRIDKLELDLGNFSINELESQFTENLKIQLNKALKKEIQHHPVANPNLPDTGKPTIQTKEKSDIELLIYYLHQGILPWWVANNKTFNLPALLDKVQEKQPDELVRALTKLDSTQAIERLVMQSSPAIYTSLLNKLSTQSDRSLIEAAKDWLLLINKLSLEDRHIARIKTRLLYLLLNPAQNSSIAMLSETIYQTALLNIKSSTEKNGLKVLVRKAQKSLSKTSEVAIWIEKKNKSQKHTPENIKHHSAKKDNASEQAEQIDSKEALTGELSDTSRQRLANQQNTDSKTSQKNDEKTNDSSIQEEAKKWENPEHYYYIDNAGIILLWPFLIRYFSSLKLIKDNAFIDDIAQEKAVLLLQYLATGKSESEEHSLLLNKLLCGWSLEQPLLRSIELSKQDKQESEALILSVIGHWKALKNTSMDGFCQSFLQREGRLSEKDHGWELFINRTGFDVLLDQLPWGISTIHLPWMEKTVFTEW